MTDHETPTAFDFIGGHLCIDFANELENLSRDDGEGRYEKLVRWAVEGGALSSSEAGRLRRRAARAPDDAGAVWERAARFGEAIDRVLLAVAAGHRPRRADLEAINGEVSIALGRLAIIGSGSEFSLDWADDAALDRVLWPVARSAADVLVHGSLERLKICDADACRYLFVDTSKSGRRRWCDMKVCGNRAKARRFRRRRAAS